MVNNVVIDVAPRTPRSVGRRALHHRGCRCRICIVIVLVVIARLVTVRQSRRRSVHAMSENVDVSRHRRRVISKRELLVSEELIDTVDGPVLLGSHPKLFGLPKRRRARRIEASTARRGRSIVVTALSLLVVSEAEIFGVFSKSCCSLSMGAAGAGGVRDAELVGVEEKSGRI